MADDNRAKTSVVPQLSVRRGREAVAFYQLAFGAVEKYRIESGGGEVVVQLSIDGADFWVADESPEHQNFSPESLRGGTVRMLHMVSDPDATFDRAIAAGAQVVWPVCEQHGWKLGRVVDPFGHHWEIGKQLD